MELNARHTVRNYDKKCELGGGNEWSDWQLISANELRQFWIGVLQYIENARIYVANQADWKKVSQLQALSMEVAHVIQTEVWWTNTTEGVIRDVMTALDDRTIKAESEELRHGLIEMALQIRQLSQPGEFSDKERLSAMARRLYQMHQFLDGKTGVEDFGAIRYQGDDFQYGLGLGLNSGELFEFFHQLKNETDLEHNGVLRQYFESDSMEFLQAIEDGQNAFETYLRSQLVLSYDPVIAQKIYRFSDHWQTRLKLFGTEPLVRQQQVSVIAGNRTRMAQEKARRAGVRSLRGFAMLFDLDEMATDSVLESTQENSGESQKCLTLADEILSKLHGRLANHWQARLNSVFTGQGDVDGRYYDESQFLGEVSGETDWENVNLTDFPEDTSVPTEGRTYLICPGERLEALVHQVYGDEVDVRYILRQNPQIRHPGDIRPGMRVYFPVRKTQNVFNTSDTQVFFDEVHNNIILGDRVIGPLSCLDDKQKEFMRDALSKIPLHRLIEARFVESYPGMAVICGHVSVWMDIKSSERFSDEEMRKWGRKIAAQIRGDIELENEKYLPFATILSQPHRRDWVGRTLKNTEKTQLRLNIHARMRCVELVNAHDEVLVRLENEDFYAIRMQPLRRLRDYIAPPITQMNDLAQLWAMDYLDIPAEIAVPPLSGANQYTVSQAENETRMVLPMGTPVYAMMRGEVVDCGRIMMPGMFVPDYFVTIKHVGGVICRFSGLSAICVHRGQKVDAESLIARSGAGAINEQSSPELGIQCYRIQPGTNGEKQVLDYFEVICRLWSDQNRLDCIMGE